MDAMNGSGPYGPPNPLAGNKILQTLSQRYRFWMDKTTPHVTGRWVSLVALLLIYAVRVYLLKGEWPACSLYPATSAVDERRQEHGALLQPH